MSNLSVQSKKRAELLSYLEKADREIAKLLPQFVTPDMMFRFTMTACSQNPKLLECDKATIGLALMNAAGFGLTPNGRDCHLVPFGKTCQLIIDYKGFIKLAYRNPNLAVIEAHAVRAKDSFDYEYGTHGFLRFKMFEPDELDAPIEARGELTHAWARFEMKDGRSGFFVMNRAQVLKRKRFSKSARSADSPWQIWEDEMWAKTPIKGLQKFAPLGDDFERAVRYDDAIEQGVTLDAPFEPTQDDVENPFVVESDESTKSQDVEDALKSQSKK